MASESLRQKALEEILSDTKRAAARAEVRLECPDLDLSVNCSLARWEAHCPGPSPNIPGSIRDFSTRR